ncbi:hypothetical protein [Streptomyces sp. NPDC059651]|uniref:hypothetical protein n=1 Tax=Streptomyces sp. NPDC059651 TaxID=3346897 RepID=UPI00369A8D75
MIRSVVCVHLDFRHAWDGIDGSPGFAPDTTWFVDGRPSRHTAAGASLRSGLAENGFTARCR